MSKIKRTIKHVKHVARKIKPRRLTKLEIQDKKRRKRLCAVLMALGYVLMFGSFFGFYQYKFAPKETSWIASLRPMTSAEREKSILMLGALVYRHDMGYAAYCQSKGYTMVNYPQTFQREFATEIQVLSDILKERGSDLNTFLPQVAQQAGPMAQQVIKVELNEFRKFIIGARQNDNTVAADALTIKDVCAIVDEHAEAVMKKSPSMDFKRIRNLGAQLD